MALDGTHLEKLLAILKDAFNRDTLAQLVRFKLGADMYKEWVPPGQPFKSDVFNLLTTLEREGLIASFLDHLITAREDLKVQIVAIRASLDVKSTTASDYAAAVKTGVASVADKIQLASVRHIVMQSQGILSDLAAKIDLLRTYKALHDGLHTAKMQFRSLEISARQMAADPMAASDFSQAVMLMEMLAASVEALVQDLPAIPASIRQDELDWLARFTASVTTARQAADAADHVTARQGVQGVRSVLRTEPSRIDGRLSRTADEIDLARLKDVFAAAAALPELAADADMLEQGRAGTEQLLRQVRAQINQHATWQAIDRCLAGADDIMRMLTPDEPWDFDALWKGLKEGVNILMNVEMQSEWAKKITAIAARVDATRAANDFVKLPVDFTRFRQEATVQFYVVDTRLKMLSNEVNAVGAPLRSLLNKL